MNNVQFARSIHEKEVKFLIEEKYAKATKLANRRIFFRTVKKVLKKPKTLNRVLYQTFLSKKTRINKNVILYESFLGRNYSDSPKYIYEYLNKHYPNKYKHVWVFNDPSRIEPTGVTKVKRFSFKHMYYMAKAKYHVNNMRQPKWFIKRPNQVFLATWHGTPLKKLVFDMNDVHSANPNYKKKTFMINRELGTTLFRQIIIQQKYSRVPFYLITTFLNMGILEMTYCMRIIRINWQLNIKNDYVFHKIKRLSCMHQRGEMMSFINLVNINLSCSWI